jgi:hypothetical protein
MAKRLRCRVGRHSWVQRRTDDNQSYLGCQHCDAVEIFPVGPRKPGGIPPAGIT